MGARQEISLETARQLKPFFKRIFATVSDFPPYSGYWQTEWYNGSLILGVEEYRNSGEPPTYYLREESEEEENGS